MSRFTILIRPALFTAFLLLPCGASLGQLPSQPREVQPVTPPATAPDDDIKPATPASPGTPATPAPAGKSPTATPAPTKPAAVQPMETRNQREPDQGPYITLSSTRDYNLTVRVRLASDNANMKETFRDPHTGKTVDMPVITPFNFQTMGIVWPIIPSTGSSVQQPDTFTGLLRLNGQPWSGSYQVLEGYPQGVKLARWDAAAEAGKEFVCRQVQLEVTTRATVGKTTFDEAAAIKVQWPKGGWPASVETCLAPQLYIETGLDANNQIRAYEDEPLETAIKTWLQSAGVSDPKRVSPVALAKILTHGVWGAVQINDRTVSGRGAGFGEITSRTGEFGGVNIQPPFQTLQSGRGSPPDAAALLTALFRKAGLPARTVIAWDTGSSDSSRVDKNITGRSRNTNRGLRYLVEFPVFDEARNTLNWVPIDITKLAKSSSRPQKLESTWRWFGENSELNMVIPFSFHFHPPTDVVAYGAPAFWGWFVTPKAPDNAEQVVTFDGAAASVRGGQPSTTPAKPGETKKDDRDEKKDERKKKLGY